MKENSTQSNNVSSHLMSSWNLLGQFPMKVICSLGPHQWTYREEKEFLTAEDPLFSMADAREHMEAECPPASYSSGRGCGNEVQRSVVSS